MGETDQLGLALGSGSGRCPFRKGTCPPESCPYKRGVLLGGVSVRNVSLTEVSMLERWPPYRKGVPLRLGGVCVRSVPSHKGVPS